MGFFDCIAIFCDAVGVTFFGRPGVVLVLGGCSPRKIGYFQSEASCKVINVKKDYSFPCKEHSTPALNLVLKVRVLELGNDLLK